MMRFVLNSFNSKGESLVPKPGSIQLIAVIYLVDGFLNIGWGFTIIFGLFSSIIGVLCLPIGIYPIAIGIIEFVYAIKLLGDPVRLSKAPYLVSVLQLTTVVVLDPIGLILGVISLLLYNSKKVKAYFDFTSSQLYPGQGYA
jgi:hypothetical protein